MERIARGSLRPKRPSPPRRENAEQAQVATTQEPLTLGDGTLVEGVLDLAFLEKDAWTVVDFKTDREFEKDLEHYKRQVGLYALAIGRATGQPSGGTLMRV